MDVAVWLVFIICSVMHVFVVGRVDEPRCLSRFDHDYKVLSNLVTLDQERQKQDDILQGLAEEIRELKQSIKDVGARSVGSTYTRWGKTTCAGNGSRLLYSGYMAGGHYTHQGVPSNYLCLPPDPLWGHFESSESSTGIPVYGAEYEFDARNRVNFFGSEIHNEDAPCAVCWTPRSSVAMIPARNECYGDWTLEYHGYLVAGHHAHSAASEFICLDERPEKIAGGSGNDNGKLMYFTEARCGNLRCPPYVNGLEFTCAVCSV